MSEIYSGHLVARHIKEVEGIDTIFTLSGGHIDTILDGCLAYGIRAIDVRHEQAAAMMAHAWSIYRGQPGVCLVTAGPGFTNALTGLVNASQENAPIVCISGAARVDKWGLGAMQELNQCDMVKSVVKWHAVCHDSARVSEYLATAFRQAVSGRPGPVFLEIPQDVLDNKIDTDKHLWPKAGQTPYRCGPDPDAVKTAADLFNQAQRPVLIGGSGVAHSDCRAELREFIEKTGTPFVLVNAGRGALPDNHPSSIWNGGLVGIHTALAQADLIITLGVRFNWFLSHGQGCLQAKLIRIDIDSSELDRNRTCQIGLSSDLTLALRALNRQVKKRDLSRWYNELQDQYMPAIQNEIDLCENPSDPIHPLRAVTQTYKVLGDEAVYIIDGGDTAYFGSVGVRTRKAGGVLTASGGQFGCLGTGIPMAIAAKAALPDTTVAVITGDGSFGLNAMEFDTALRHNLPIICIINNDQSWGMIRHGQEIKYGADRLVATNLGIVRYEKIVEGLGGYGEFVEKDQDLMPAIQRAVESGKPACINVLTDTAAISLATYQFVGGFKK
jgi:acetolactate synthase-1/2/3 large subunit